MAKGRPVCTLARRSVLQRVDAKPIQLRQGTPLADFFNIVLRIISSCWIARARPGRWIRPLWKGATGPL
ncbi:MAG TPA: hypothetical protein DD706_22875 [Nitrospiraceae bacterium]|nr:hypothetical protein [Nitrospiraceae bacterium]